MQAVMNDYVMPAVGWAVLFLIIGVICAIYWRIGRGIWAVLCAIVDLLAVDDKPKSPRPKP